MKLVRSNLYHPDGTVTIRRGIVISCLSLLSTSAIYAQVEQAGKLKAYQAPVGALLNHDFSVKVRLPGQSWQSIPTYLIKVDQVKDG